MKKSDDPSDMFSLSDILILHLNDMLYETTERKNASNGQCAVGDTRMCSEKRMVTLNGVWG